MIMMNRIYKTYISINNILRKIKYKMNKIHIIKLKIKNKINKNITIPKTMMYQIFLIVLERKIMNKLYKR